MSLQKYKRKCVGGPYSRVNLTWYLLCTNILQLKITGKQHCLKMLYIKGTPSIFLSYLTFCFKSKCTSFTWHHFMVTSKNSMSYKQNICLHDSQSSYYILYGSPKYSTVQCTSRAQKQNGVCLLKNLNCTFILVKTL